MRRAPFAVSSIAALLLTGFSGPWAGSVQGGPSATPHEGRIPLGKGSLYVRDIGRGLPTIVLHGGPDFDQARSACRP